MPEVPGSIEPPTLPAGAGDDRLAIPRVPTVSDLPIRVLAVKEQDTFVYSDVEGNLDDRRELGLGLYHRDTRFLSHYRLRLSGRDPHLLSSSAARAYIAHVDLTNPDLRSEDDRVIPQHSLNIRRSRVVDGRLLERIRIRNYNRFPVQVEVELSFGADFADIFEVRGLARETRGTYDPPRVDANGAEFGYQGEDGIARATRISFGRPAVRSGIRGDMVEAAFTIRLAPSETDVLAVTVEPVVGGGERRPSDFDASVQRLRRSYDQWEGEATRIRTNNELFDEMLAQSVRDLRALSTDVEGGSVLAAGIPWYVAAFGRDTLLTAHQILTVNPAPARESLRALAARQGSVVDDWRDEEPGKILHEIRAGELAGGGYLPHSPYYGSVDSTPWFLVVLAQYFRWTNDLGSVKELLPAANAALEWIDRHGDLDGDGLVEYRARSPRGLANHGWKDSADSVVHADGALAEPPIALAEVQGYVYMAKTRMAEVFSALGDHERAIRLREEALILRRRFDEAFWLEEEGFYAMALDGEKRPVRTVTSNPGHGLYCGIVEPARAEAVARRLFQPDLFSGWGIRTMSRSAAAYNPMSYHNGSVWPHDNALIAAGLKRYGLVEPTNRIATALFEAASYQDDLRLPELFCGFVRRSQSPPVGYPVACVPQAWATGAPFLLLQAMLGISARANENLLTVNQPHLPPWLEEVELLGLKVGDSSLSLVFRRDGDTTGFSLLSKQGDVRVVMEK
jgi:glycogen debranching enzyme